MNRLAGGWLRRLIGRLPDWLVIGLKGAVKAIDRLIAGLGLRIGRLRIIVPVIRPVARIGLGVIGEAGIGTSRRVTGRLVRRIVWLGLGVCGLRIIIPVIRPVKWPVGLIILRWLTGRRIIGVCRRIIWEAGVVTAAIVVIPVIPAIVIIPAVIAIIVVSTVIVVVSTVIVIVPAVVVIPAVVVEIAAIIVVTIVVEVAAVVIARIIAGVVAIDRSIDRSGVVERLNPGRGKGAACVIGAIVVNASIYAGAVDREVVVVGAFARSAAFADGQGSDRGAGVSSYFAGVGAQAITSVPRAIDNRGITDDRSLIDDGNIVRFPDIVIAHLRAGDITVRHKIPVVGGGSISSAIGGIEAHIRSHRRPAIIFIAVAPADPGGGPFRAG